MLPCKTIASRFLERGLRLNKFTIRIRTNLTTHHIRSRERNSQNRKRSRHTQPWWRSSSNAAPFLPALQDVSQDVFSYFRSVLLALPHGRFSSLHTPFSALPLPCFWPEAVPPSLEPGPSTLAWQRDQHAGGGIITASVSVADAGIPGCTQHHETYRSMEATTLALEDGSQGVE